ncbi:MBL fold metallo-hydrolase [Saccharopolyspora aridisoli]|uniref:MBL fold metallo-hydrolase n=1 Tax=Saccharopolyspora aridisoli TaxID=2530385 RepID=A0A4R4V3M4_9PSEU|nr:MBL fold metallo-hydrolase [Saccharopolyspora aridisoli]TDC96852.1 MBL fold metallo-hydrolase [Saccharopolyspora aridisoli]
MVLPICATCGMQYAEAREDCPICEDERQWVPREGQQWTDLDALRAERRAVLRDEGGVLGIGCEPKFAIGQRALLVRTGAGSVLWDCTAYLDDEIVSAINELGGLIGIAISHPHYYTTMIEWARAFDVPIHLHEADRQWVGRPDPAIRFWNGTTHEIIPGLALINLGVHFAGGTVLHSAAGRGSLFTGDIVQVIPDRTHVGFMYSYPNLIPERPSVVRRAAELLDELTFDSLHGAWWDTVIPTGAHEIVQRSAARYLRFVREE